MQIWWGNEITITVMCDMQWHPKSPANQMFVPLPDLFRPTTKKTSKLHITGSLLGDLTCVWCISYGKWWRHDMIMLSRIICMYKWCGKASSCHDVTIVEFCAISLNRGWVRVWMSNCIGKSIMDVITYSWHKLKVYHDDVIKWKHFPRYWPFVRGIHRDRWIPQHKGQWRGALMFSLICARINGWVNNGEAGDLRRHRAHCDVIVMIIYVSKILPEYQFTEISGAWDHMVRSYQPEISML